AYPELPLLDEFRQTWTRLSTDRQLRQSEQLVPENAGPLNSSHLAHRSLSLMQGLSPGYLQQFLSYVDALGWLEQLAASAAPATRDAARATPRKTARGRAR
ncbi:PF11445 domain protein, partial [Bordetella bronchiseptica E012]